MPAFRPIAAAILCGVTWFAPISARGQQPDAQALVREIVQGELAADARDHSRWMFRDANKVLKENTVKLVVQTPDGSLSRTIEIDGRPLTPPQREEDERKMREFLADPALRQQQRRNEQQDGQKAKLLTLMLPDGFLWTRTGESGEETTLSFKPNPHFNPPSREARVFAAMAGAMVVNTQQKRIVSLKGRLTQNVNFGLGIFGQLKKGGTFDVERRQIGPNIWEITQTHVHIQGHALIFKSIREEQDEETSDYKPAPGSLTLKNAAKMLDDGIVAKDLTLAETH